MGVSIGHSMANSGPFQRKLRSSSGAMSEVLLYITSAILLDAQNPRVIPPGTKSTSMPLFEKHEAAGTRIYLRSAALLPLRHKSICETLTPVRPVL